MKSGLDSKIKGLLFVLSGAIIVTASLVLFWANFIKTPTASLEIYIGDQKRVFEGETIPNMTVLDALVASSLAGQITLKYKLDPVRNKTAIITLDGHDGIAYQNIRLYLNSKPIDVGSIHSIIIRPGDVMTVRLP